MIEAVSFAYNVYFLFYKRKIFGLENWLGIADLTMKYSKADHGLDYSKSSTELDFLFKLEKSAIW